MEDKGAPMGEMPELVPFTLENRVLAENVRPPGWINPEPAGRYHLAVIGAGTAGLVAAAGAASLGARVALIERRLLGGDCLNVGCVPSKGVLRASRVVGDAARALEFGIAGCGRPSVDFAAVMERMRRIRAEISPHDSARRFRDELGVDIFFGEGEFTGHDTIRVGGRPLRFARAAVCTGARATVPVIAGLEEAGYLTNDTVFSLTSLPARLAVIGAGPMGCELAQAFARLGSRVCILGHRSDRILPREDRDAAEIVQRAFVRDGIELHLPVRIVRVSTRGGERVVTVDREGGTLDIAVDEILVGVGRTPNVEGLNLEAAGISYDPASGVGVDDRLRTSNPRVFAAGDICSPYRFTHAADAQARILIANALFMGRRRSSALVIPWCTYTDPEVAHVGMREDEARERGSEVVTLTVPLDQVDRALLDGETEGFARVRLKKGTDRILGATIVARHAGEMINELTLAMSARLGLAAIGRTIHPYPTQAEAIRKLADAYQRTRLTPFMRKALAAWFRYVRR